MLHSVSVENFRSFADRATIHLRPITILLGRNSAGKSSLTRLFPLLRQSMERGTSAPILWNSSSVDFGRISDVINRRHPNRPVQITFELRQESLVSLGWRIRSRHAENEAPEYAQANISFTASLRAGTDSKTHYDRIDLTINLDHVRVDIRGNSALIYINGKRIDKGRYWQDIIVGVKQLFPYVLFDIDDGRLNEHPNTKDALIYSLSKVVNLPEPDDIFSNATRHRRAGVIIDTSQSLVMPFVPREGILPLLAQIEGFKGFSNILTSSVDEIADLLLLTYLNQIIEFVGAKVTAAMQNLSYLGPIRASGNRFYREQELSVDKIDDTGENLATYIGSLTKQELDGFNKILFDSFGVEVRPHPEAGHLSIEIGRPGDEKYDNLADVGFGYSQVLPLVAQIHSENRRDKFFRTVRDNQIQISAIEQPELHLHPAYQANLADLFVASITETRKFGKTPVIILETHSEALVGRIGELISMGRLSPDDVAVHFVDKDETLGASTVRLAEFDEDGMIVDWPVGFFSAR